MSSFSDNDKPFLESEKKRNDQIAKVKALFAAAKLTPHQPTRVADGRILRPLVAPEIDTLNGPCRCCCLDWSKILLLLSAEQVNKDQSRLLEKLVSQNTFVDVVVIGLDDTSSPLVDEENDVFNKLPTGVHGNNIISNCVIEPHTRVYHNSFLCDTYIGVAAILLKCGSVTCAKNVTFGHLYITVGPENGGGRKLAVTAESTMMDICRELEMSRQHRSQKLSRSDPCDVNIIGPYSLVRDTLTLKSIFLSSHSSITAATYVRNSTLLDNAKICNSCTVSNTLLQWNSSISDNSSVSDTLLMEEAHSGPHSLVASSVLGPDVHVSAGEVHTSVLGPNTNAHHQSLVIGVLWPLGRGNVGYGANVGSNHTGRLPDQEAVAGEGTFWGLSTVIKFPVDLSNAPYSIVAAGTNMPPQRITMPFSLIVEQNGVCNIIPGWVLQSSPYTLCRSEVKFAKRRKAKRHSFYTGWKIIRPDIVDVCIEARDALEQAGAQPAAVYKTEKQVRGIGACHLTEKGRLTGIEAYTQCIQLYALRGLFDRTLDSRQSPQQLASNILAHSSLMRPVDSAEHVSWPPLPWEKDDVSTWSHQLSILQAEFPMSVSNPTLWIVDLLQRLATLQKDYAKRVRDCKARDDTRGAHTIPGYAESHVAADNDPAVKAVYDETTSIVDNVEKILGALDTPFDQRSRL